MSTRRRWVRSPLGVLAVLWVCCSLFIVSCGGEGSPDAAGGGTVVDVVMKEMRFIPDHFRFRVGEVVTFRFHNEGKVRHEAVIGDQAAQDAAVAAMDAMSGSPTTVGGARGRSRTAIGHPGMGLPNVVSVEPGEVGTIVFQFAKAATLLMQCHEAGHLEGGMAATIEIVE